MACSIRYFVIILTASLLVAGCETGQNHQQGQFTQNFSASNTRVVNFREGCKVGDRYSVISINEAVWGNSGEPMVLKIKVDWELLRIDNGNYTWKTTTYQNIEQMGSHEFIQGKGLSNNRVEYATYNSHGNLIYTEGWDPDAGVAYDVNPERPVTIGDTWQGYTMERGKKFTNTYTLEAITNINGKEYAVVRAEDEEEGGSSTSKKWIEISTGITIKSEGSGTGVNLIGQRGKWRFSYIKVDQQGRPFLP